MLLTPRAFLDACSHSLVSAQHRHGLKGDNLRNLPYLSRQCSPWHRGGVALATERIRSLRRSYPAYPALPRPRLRVVTAAAGHTVVGFLYLPLVAWAPLLAAVTFDYYRRHRPAPAAAGAERITMVQQLVVPQGDPSRNVEGAAVILKRSLSVSTNVSLATNF